MPSVLGTNLVDLLVPTVDSLRASLYPSMGTRQYQVTIVVRRWSGGEVGVGTATRTETLLSPQPMVDWANRDYRLGPTVGCGLTDAGECTLSEVSLTLTESELLGLPREMGKETYYRLSDAHGQGIATTHWVPAGVPEPDRERGIGWIVKLRRYETVEGQGSGSGILGAVTVAATGTVV